jgi:hypothetical protein
MKYFFSLVCLLVFRLALAQPAALESLDLQHTTLKERYDLMKSKSQTYGDYKVVKEYILDGVWKIAVDSIRANKILVQNANATIANLENEVGSLKTILRQKESSMADIEYDSTHISMMGIGMDKALFKVLVVLIVLGLLLLLGVMTGKLKLMYLAIKEKVELINITSHEFEEYKRKALERQTKLSRELQTERNKLMELRRG